MTIGWSFHDARHSLMTACETAHEALSYEYASPCCIGAEDFCSALLLNPGICAGSWDCDICKFGTCGPEVAGDTEDAPPPSKAKPKDAGDRLKGVPVVTTDNQCSCPWWTFTCSCRTAIKPAFDKGDAKDKPKLNAVTTTSTTTMG